MEPDGISMIALPVNSALSYQPPNVYPVRVGVGRATGKSELVYSVGATTPAGNEPELVFNVIVYDSTHFAQYSLSPVEPDGISVIALPVNSALSYHPPKVYPVRVGVGRATGKSESVYSVGTTTPAGNVPELVFNVIV